MKEKLLERRAIRSCLLAPIGANDSALIRKEKADSGSILADRIGGYGVVDDAAKIVRRAWRVEESVAVLYRSRHGKLHANKVSSIAVAISRTRFCTEAGKPTFWHWVA